MDIEQAIQAAGDEMLQQSHANTEQAFMVEEASEELPMPQPIDMWQQRRNAQAQLQPALIRGASPRMQLDLGDLLDGPIKDAYRKTVDDSELLRAQGETERARLLEQQYMQDYYYPVIDALIRLNSMEEVLASQDTLEALDALALVPGGGSTDGYASVFISNLYAPAGNTFKSDAEVRRAVDRVRMLAAQGEVRQAAAIAQRMQAKIDAGQNVALPEDYELLQRVVLRTM